VATWYVTPPQRKCSLCVKSHGFEAWRLQFIEKLQNAVNAKNQHCMRKQQHKGPATDSIATFDGVSRGTLKA
jgi:hypothetical protein